jgi:hypothetical protein
MERPQVVACSRLVQEGRDRLVGNLPKFLEPFPNTPLGMALKDHLDFGNSSILDWILDSKRSSLYAKADEV